MYCLVWLGVDSFDVPKFQINPIYPEGVIYEGTYKLLTIYMQILLKLRLHNNRTGRRGGCLKNPLQKMELIYQKGSD